METIIRSSEMQDAALHRAQDQNKRSASSIDYPIDSSLLPTIPWSGPSQEAPAAKKARTIDKDTMADNATADESPSESKKALKNSRRAEQNRAAQQAFRARKDERMKELEGKAEKFDALVDQQAELERLSLEIQEMRKTVSSREMVSAQRVSEQKVLELEAEVKRCVGYSDRDIMLTQRRLQAALRRTQSTTDDPPFAANALVRGLQQELENRVQEQASSKLRAHRQASNIEPSSDANTVIIGLQTELENKEQEIKRLNELLHAVSDFLRSSLTLTLLCAVAKS